MNNSAGPSKNNVNQENNSENMENLSDVNLFKEICGIDDATAIALLHESGGNLEAAIHQYFFTRENPEVLQNHDNEVQELRRRVILGTNPAQTLPLAPTQQFPMISWSQWIRGIVFIPFHYLYSTAMDIFLFVSSLFFGVPPNRRRISGNSPPSPQAVRSSDVLADRIIMREQQQAYEQALAIDKRKMEQRKMEERRAQEEADRANNRRLLLRQKRGEVSAKMHPEPDGSEEDLVRIRISFPSCARMERNFRHSDSLERLFEVAFVHSDCPDNFSLFTNFPVKQLNCAPNWYLAEFCPDGPNKNDEPIDTFAGAELIKSANVVVRDNEA